MLRNGYLINETDRRKAFVLTRHQGVPMGRLTDIQLLKWEDASRLGRPDQKFIVPRKLSSLCTLGDVSSGYDHKGFIWVIFLQIKEKKVENERGLTIYRVVLSPSDKGLLNAMKQGKGRSKITNITEQHTKLKLSETDGQSYRCDSATRSTFSNRTELAFVGARDGQNQDLERW